LRSAAKEPPQGKRAYFVYVRRHFTVSRGLTAAKGLPNPGLLT
jgi:hypothetical protein